MRLSRLSDEAVWDIFRCLPGRVGVSESELRAAESRLDVRLPEAYRDLMLEGGRSLAGADILLPLERLFRIGGPEGDSRQPQAKVLERRRVIDSNLRTFVVGRLRCYLSG